VTDWLTDCLQSVDLFWTHGPLPTQYNWKQINLKSGRHKSYHSWRVLLESNEVTAKWKMFKKFDVLWEEITAEEIGEVKRKDSYCDDVLGCDVFSRSDMM